MAKTKTLSPSALKLKECDRFVKIAGEKVPCPGKWLGNARCPNWDTHLTKYPTGHCQVGAHEGGKALSHSGVPLKTCDHIVTCPCKCHADLDKLFAMSDRPRVFVDVSGYKVPPREFWMPSDDPDYVSSLGADPVTPRTHEEAAVTAERAPVTPTYAPTPTGRAARGELESWVHDAVQVWLVEQDGFCTPAYVAREIKKTQAVPEPSVGAIDAVYKRWVKLGYATMDKKPTRITGLTEAGKTHGLWKMKERAKRDEARRRAEQRRGSLR